MIDSPEFESYYLDIVAELPAITADEVLNAHDALVSMRGLPSLLLKQVRKREMATWWV